jgi:host factor-I protein
LAGAAFLMAGSHCHATGAEALASAAMVALENKQVSLKALEIGTMDSKPAQNIQDTFLNTVRKDKTPITIYLVSGVKLTGRIRSFDKYSVLLENNSQEQLIFKHAISTVVSNRSVMHDHRLGHPPAAVPHSQPTPLRQEAES